MIVSFLKYENYFRKFNSILITYGQFIASREEQSGNHKKLCYFTGNNAPQLLL